MQLSNQSHDPALSEGALAHSSADLLQQATLKVQQAFIQNNGSPYKQSLALQQIKNDYLAQRYNIQPNSVQS